MVVQRCVGSWVGSLVLPATLLATLAGCGGGEHSPPAGDPTAPSPPPASGPVSDAAPPRLPSGPAPAELEAAVAAVVAPHVDAEGKNGMAVGATVGIVTPTYRVTYSFGATRKGGTTADGKTLYGVGSNSKVFTGLLLALETLDGTVSPDDELQKYAPAGITVPSYQGVPIRLGDMATHTSALPRSVQAMVPAGQSPFGTFTTERTWSLLGGYTLPYAPETTYVYSNVAFGLLGEVMVLASGAADFETLLHERVTGVLGMADTYVYVPEDKRGRLAQGYTPTGTEEKPLDGALPGSGMILSTADDMITLLAAESGVLSTALDPAFAAQREARGNQVMQRTRFGLDAQSVQGRAIFTKSGVAGGFNSFTAFSTDPPMGIVVLANGGPDDGPGAVTKDVFRAVMSAPEGEGGLVVASP